MRPTRAATEDACSTVNIRRLLLLRLQLETRVERSFAGNFASASAIKRLTIVDPTATYSISFLRPGFTLDCAMHMVCDGTAHSRIFADQRLRAIEVPLPPLPEQRRIAEILDKADGAAGQAPRRPRPTRHPHPIHLPRHVRRPRHESERLVGAPFAELGENQDSQRVPVKSSDRDDRKGKYPYYGASGIIDLG